MAQYVTINLKKDVIVMKISDKASEEDTLKSLKKKLPELKKLYQKEKTPIFVTGKILRNKELREIQELIQKTIDVEVEFEGTLIILGDVNDGAEAIAGENVIVVGTLRGLAHAGAKGNKQAIIAANKIESPQIRISNIIKEMERNDDDYNVALTYASVEDDRIIVE